MKKNGSNWPSGSKLLKFPFYPLLISAFPSLSLFSHNFNELSIVQLLIPLVVSVSGGSAVFGLISLLLKSWSLGAAVASAGILLFFSYGSFVYLIDGFPLLMYAANRSYLVISGLVFIGFVLAVIRFRNKLQPFTTLANILAVSIVTVPLLTILYLQFFRMTHNPGTREKIQYNSQTENAAVQKPDIYYIIMDRYASSDSLREFYGYDNRDFLQFLTDRGFYLRETDANYPFTAPSVASSLNMNYLDRIINYPDKDSSDYAPIDESIKENEVVHYLKSWGYKYYHFGAEVGPTSASRHADYNYSYWGDRLHLSEFSRILLNQTGYFPVATFINELSQKKFTPDEVIRKRSYELAVDQIDTAVEIVNEGSPKFVFIHSLITHDPYVMNEDGSYISLEDEQNFPETEIYLKQLKYANKALQKLISAIQDNSARPAVIILQSDEGPFPARAEENFYDFDWESATPEELKQKFGIINAYYLPGIDQDMVPEDVTPVNTFRLLFNLYLGENLQLLENKHYAWKDKNHPYREFEISAVLK